MGCGCIGLFAAVAVGTFLITGNYEQALKVGNWLAASPPPTATLQVVATPSLPPHPSSTPTVTPTHRPTQESTRTPIPVSTPLLTSSETNDWSWASETEIPYEQVTEALNAIWVLSTHDAARKVNDLLATRETTSEMGRRTIDLLIAVGLERTGDSISARSAYADIVAQAKDTPYANSADFRLRILEKPDRSIKDSDALFKTIASEPEAVGWFLISNRWIWSTSRRAASQMLVELRADELSFRFFQFLREKSPFSASYAYFFILLALTGGAKVLEMPLSIRSAKTAVALRRLQPQIQLIQNMYSDDPVAMNQSLMELYKSRGINMWGGCALTVVDLIFVVWAMITLRNFTPQMTLDSARFFWAADVTRPDLRILLIWGLMSIIQPFLAGTFRQTQQFGQQSAATMGCSMLVGSAILIAIAWYWKWPAYVLIFWLLLTAVGLFITGILTGIARVRSG